jgi:hypothetical protein
MRFRVVTSMLLPVLVGACVFVQPTAEGKKVRILTAKEVDRCQNLGTVTSRVQDHIGVIPRSLESVQDDVVVNAQNAAATRGADTIVPMSEMKDGEQTFGLYRCL